MTDRLRIVARTNGVGIDRDVRLLTDAIARWREPPAFARYRSISPLRRWFARRDADECIIFLERVTRRWLGRAGSYLLIPNQERYARRLIPLLRHIDHVLCKSEHARGIFADLHPSVHFIGFTSTDRALPDSRPDHSRFFHLAGGSILKGTDALLDLWRRHPEWPELTVVRHGGGSAGVPSNVRLITHYLEDEELRRLQNSCGIHLCPSLSEGWGHYIVEAMSCGAVTLVTDGPPMNELVRPGRGVLVPYHRTEPRKLGVNFHVDPAALERAIAGLIEMPEAEKQRLGAAARAWFEENDQAFARRLREVMEGLQPLRRGSAG